MCRCARDWIAYTMHVMTKQSRTLSQIILMAYWPIVYIGY